MPTVLIVGASRGLGLEFARQYLATGARVIATVRREADAQALHALGARPLLLDLDAPASIEAFTLGLAAERIDLALLNAGVYGPRCEGLIAPTPENFDRVMHTNVRAPMLLIPALAPLLARSRGKLAILSSRLGSMALAQNPAGWLYRASKAAANSVLKSASLALAEEGVICLALHPGWVRTDMGGAGADIDVATSVSGLRAVIERAGPEANGHFFDYRGEELPW